jgi:hypothetical protein
METLTRAPRPASANLQPCARQRPAPPVTAFRPAQANPVGGQSNCGYRGREIIYRTNDHRPENR